VKTILKLPWLPRDFCLFLFPTYSFKILDFNEADLLGRGLFVNLKYGGEDGRLPVVLALADVPDVDRVLPSVHQKDGSVPATRLIV
jgi:hypothetical protein